MNEYLLLIETKGNIWTDLSQDEIQNHMKNGLEYITRLREENILVSAAPVAKNAKTLSKIGGKIKEEPFNEGEEIIAGYFVISAESLDQAVSIAKSNPIFEDIPTVINVFPLMKPES